MGIKRMINLKKPKEFYHLFAFFRGMEESNTRKDSSTNVDRCYRPEVQVHMDIGPTFTQGVVQKHRGLYRIFSEDKVTGLNLVERGIKILYSTEPVLFICIHRHGKVQHEIVIHFFLIFSILYFNCYHIYLQQDAPTNWKHPKTLAL